MFHCSVSFDCFISWCVFSHPQPSKLSDDLVQQFLLPDQTPPILEAEMSLRTEKTVNGDRHPAQSELKTSLQRRNLSPEVKSPSPVKEVKREVTSEHVQEAREEKVSKATRTPEGEDKREQKEVREEREEEVIEERQEPEGRPAEPTMTEHEKTEVCMSRGTVWAC